MTDFTDIEQTATNGTTAPQKRRGPKPGAKKAAKPAVQEAQAAPFTPQELVDAVNTMKSWPDALRACAMALVAAMPKAPA